jgi:hypothetical protein
MKNLILVFWVTILLTFSLCVGISIGENPLGNVDLVDGKVIITRGEETLEAYKGMDLFKEDIIKTWKKASITIIFKGDVTGTLAAEKEVTVNDFYLRSKIDALKKSIKKPESDAEPAKIETTTIGGTRGTEEGAKKARQLKNDHHWEEKVE